MSNFSAIFNKYLRFVRSFFNYMNLQVVKINGIDEIILAEPGPGQMPEFVYICIQPDGFAQIEGIADFIKRPEYHLSSGQAVIAYGNSGIFDKIVVSENLSPHTKHGRPPLSGFYVANISFLRKKVKLRRMRMPYNAPAAGILKGEA